MKMYFLFLALIFNLTSAAQQYDATWVMGYANTVYKFNESSIYRIDSFSYEKSLYYFLSGGCMSDKNGNLLYISNGIQINDRFDNLMEGGNQLKLGAFDTIDGYDFRQSPLSLPMPGNDSLYYIFYEAYWDTTLNQCSRLYYGIIDMHANNGLGKVVSLNNILVDAFISDGGLSACKHANGIDWWLVKPRSNSNQYYKFLVKGSGVIEGPFIQNIGLQSHRPDYNSELVFSPAGDKMFFTNGMQKGVLFDFDRCSGDFENPRYIWVTYGNEIFGGDGASFSPNGRFLYLTGDSFKLYQVDTYSPNIDSSKLVLSHVDLNSISWPDYQQLAPNGKIYIMGYGSPTPLTVINYPDSFGFACGLDTFAYDSLPFTTLGMPNFPYYRTPPARAYQADAGNDTTICFGDTVILGVPAVDSVTYQWLSSDGQLSSIVAQPMVMPLQTTSYYLTINDTVPRGYSCNIRTDTVTVHVVPQPCVLNVADVSNAAAYIKLYPNPAKGYTTLYYNIPVEQQAVLAIYNQLGQLMIEQKLLGTDNRFILNTNQLGDGVYSYRFVMLGEVIKREKFVVLR